MNTKVMLGYPNFNGVEFFVPGGRDVKDETGELETQIGTLVRVFNISWSIRYPRIARRVIPAHSYPTMVQVNLSMGVVSVYLYNNSKIEHFSLEKGKCLDISASTPIVIVFESSARFNITTQACEVNLEWDKDLDSLIGNKHL